VDNSSTGDDYRWWLSRAYFRSLRPDFNRNIWRVPGTDFLPQTGPYTHWVNDNIVVVSVAPIVVSVAGLAFAHPAHWSPFILPNSGHFGEFGVSGVLTGVAIVFYAYVGFELSALAVLEPVYRAYGFLHSLLPRKETVAT
jgi:hypothetical protein